MSEIKHTPGPWEVGGPWPSVTVIVCVDGGSTHPEFAEPPTYEPICYLDMRTSGEPTEETLANARLIASAPDLLAKLTRLHAAATAACIAFGSETERAAIQHLGKVLRETE